MIPIENFSNLSLMEKGAIVFGNGKLLFTQYKEGYKISLFDLRGEFFEVTSSNESTKLIKIEQLNDYDKLQTYYATKNQQIPEK